MQKRLKNSGCVPYLIIQGKGGDIFQIWNFTKLRNFAQKENQNNNISSNDRNYSTVWL